MGRNLKIAVAWAEVPRAIPATARVSLAARRPDRAGLFRSLVA
jgi:hypothetical protein